MYAHTHPRIRKYVMVGADLPPPELNRVKSGCPERPTLCLQKYRLHHATSQFVLGKYEEVNLNLTNGFVTQLIL